MKGVKAFLFQFNLPSVLTGNTTGTEVKLVRTFLSPITKKFAKKDISIVAGKFPLGSFAFDKMFCQKFCNNQPGVNYPCNMFLVTINF